LTIWNLSTSQASGCPALLGSATGVLTVNQTGGCVAGDYLVSVQAAASGQVAIPASITMHIVAAAAGSPVPITYGPGVNPNNAPILEAIRNLTISDIRGRVVIPVAGASAFLDVWDTPAGTACGGTGAVKVNTTQFNANNTPYATQQLFQGSYSMAQNHYLCLVRTGSDSWLAGSQLGDLQVSAQ
jgi:hypothetical protein